MLILLILLRFTLKAEKYVIRRIILTFVDFYTILIHIFAKNFVNESNITLINIVLFF